MAELKVYADRRSQPSRAILIFCKVNGIDFEEVPIDLFKGEHHAPAYEEINPMKQVPAIVHEDLKLNESHAILIYIASAFPGVADQWYPSDVKKRAKLHSVLDWHHSNLRRGAAGYIQSTVLAPFLKRQKNPIAAAECEKILTASLSTIETIWLQGEGKFLLGSEQPSIADLSLVCEIMQLQMIDDDKRARLMGSNDKVKRWIEDVKDATNPHFDELHTFLFETAAEMKNQVDSPSKRDTLFSWGHTYFFNKLSLSILICLISFFCAMYVYV